MRVISSALSTVGNFSRFLIRTTSCSNQDRLSMVTYRNRSGAIKLNGAGSGLAVVDEVQEELANLFRPQLFRGSAKVLREPFYAADVGCGRTRCPRCPP